MTAPSLAVTLYPSVREKTVHEYTLPIGGQFVSDLKLHCHPLVIDGPFLYTLRLSVHDIDTAEYVCDNIVLYQIKNVNRSEPENISQIPPDYSVGLDFFNTPKIITGALMPVTLRLTFWREPVTPLWLTCLVHYGPAETGVLDFTTHKYWNKMIWQ
jgi:hypothetical protein